MKAKEIVTSALLAALSLLIPIAFGGYLKIYIPPFSATLASHVPSMISMLVSPTAAVMVGLGSTLGFLLIMGPVVAARAFVHVFFGLTGALMIKKGLSFQKALILVAPIHAIGEALIVLPLGFELYTAFVVVGIGTLLHHLIDSAVSIGLVKVLSSGLYLSSG